MDTTQPQIDSANAEITQLKARVIELERLLGERQVQQIAFPLDRASIQIISKALGL